MSLCRSPTELDIPILESLHDGQSALNAISTANKYFRGVAKPILYRDLDFSKATYLQTSRLLMTVLDRRELAKHIPSVTTSIRTEADLKEGKTRLKDYRPRLRELLRAVKLFCPQPKYTAFWEQEIFTEPSEEDRSTRFDGAPALVLIQAVVCSQFSSPRRVRPSAWDSLEAPWVVAQQTYKPPDEEVELFGYIGTRRDTSSKLSFTMLRNKNQNLVIQLVSGPQGDGTVGTEAHACLRSLKEFTPVIVKGKLKERQPPKQNTVDGIKLIEGRELAVTSVQSLNNISDDIIIKNDTVFGPDQRHLQLRTDSALRSDIITRSKALSRARLHLNKTDWREIETPILFKSTPEGAREFLVPTRQKGLAYALPQSPQQYKQILMASGFTRYYQFARCFRDEDLRADRQPEFTQLDMEMSFASEEDVMHETERLLRELWHKVPRKKTPERFQRMTYQTAMAQYGSDKPDLRFEAQIHTITEHLTPDLIGKITSLQGPAVDAIKIPISEDPKITRKFVSNFLDSPNGKVYLDNPDGQPGIFIGDLSQPMQGLGPLGRQYEMEGPEALKPENGDLLVLQARPNTPFSGGSTVLGNLRLALHKAAIAQGLIEAPAKDDFKFVWITDFPLFTPSSDSEPGQGGSAGFSSTHHPFTAPKTPEDVDKLLTDPSSAVAAHYDIVLNGVELGGGSRRIHSAAMQEFIFKDILKMKPERVEDFRHLLDVLRSGCPPHAGIALGWDRLMAVMCVRESVRDVIAFPKSGKGEDLLVKSPNRMTEEQLATYHLNLRD
ncbi:aspartyl-tRNA synthetase [Alternaria panax]|uniref:Aspartyl-tRNA synthetase n=1 Tax=Alternaria panax TaxID=48097 RepID=A0AAD4I5Q3_9PLEO|nr:aspartyl-tRNA synthetase [Alternaria panax]